MRSFGLVDQKLAEADFFLERLSEVNFDMFAVECYFSAFTAAARSTTFALQGCLADHPDFREWYAEKQKALKNDRLARFFQRARTESQHLGISHIRSGSWAGPDNSSKALYYFQSPFDFGEQDLPQTDVVQACREYLTMLVELVFECYDFFGLDIDPDQYYTLTNLRRLGKTVEDFEEELGYPRGWTDFEGADERIRIRVLYQQEAGTELDEIFEKYLGKNREELVKRHER